MTEVLIRIRQFRCHSPGILSRSISICTTRETMFRLSGKVLDFELFCDGKNS